MMESGCYFITVCVFSFYILVMRQLLELTVAVVDRSYAKLHSADATGRKPDTKYTECAVNFQA